MIIFKKKSFTGVGLLNTNAPGFIKGRKYDQDLDRLGRMNTAQRELHRTCDLNKEIRKMNKELNDGRLGKWQDM